MCVLETEMLKKETFSTQQWQERVGSADLRRVRFSSKCGRQESGKTTDSFVFSELFRVTALPADVFSTLRTLKKKKKNKKSSAFYHMPKI